MIGRIFNGFQESNFGNVPMLILKYGLIIYKKLSIKGIIIFLTGFGDEANWRLRLLGKYHVFFGINGVLNLI